MHLVDGGAVLSDEGSDVAVHAEGDDVEDSRRRRWTLREAVVEDAEVGEGVGQGFDVVFGYLETFVHAEHVAYGLDEGCLDSASEDRREGVHDVDAEGVSSADGVVDGLHDRAALPASPANEVDRDLGEELVEDLALHVLEGVAGGMDVACATVALSAFFFSVGGFVSLPEDVHEDFPVGLMDVKQFAEHLCEVGREGEDQLEIVVLVAFLTWALGSLLGFLGHDSLFCAGWYSIRSERSGGESGLIQRGRLAEFG